MKPVEMRINENDDFYGIFDSMKTGNVLIVFTDGRYSIVDENYEGKLFFNNSQDMICSNPIDLNWKPLWVGMRLYNGEVRILSHIIQRRIPLIACYYKK